MVYGSNKLLLISINISQEMVMDDGRIVPTGPQATRVPRQNCTAHRLTLDDVPVVGDLQKKLTNDSRFKTCALYEAFLVRSGQPFQERQALCCSRFLCSRRVPDKTLVGQPFYLPMQ